MFRGCTSPPTIRRSAASPEADTMSYSPVRIKVTISSLVPATRELTTQPVSAVNGSTHFGSTKPDQLTMFSSPSKAPSSAFIGTSGTVRVSSPLVVAQPDSTRALAASSAGRASLLLLIYFLSFMLFGILATCSLRNVANTLSPASRPRSCPGNSSFSLVATRRKPASDSNTYKVLAPV